MTNLCDEILALDDSSKSHEETVKLAKCIDVLNNQVQKRRQSMALSKPATLARLTKEENSELQRLFQMIGTSDFGNGEAVSGLLHLLGDRSAST